MNMRIFSCRSGAVAVITALTLPLLLGFAGIGVEVGHWYLGQRQMQGAADAAAISAAAQYIADQNAGNGSSTAYQTTGQSYALLNGFTIPTANTCLFASGGDNCGPVRALDARPIVCSNPPCVVVEITQNTLQWLSTKASVEPNGLGRVQSIPTPILMARAIVSVKSVTETKTFTGSDCVLALANASDAVTVSGGGALRAKCGIAIDGGIDQNVNGTPLGGITFNGANSKVQINTLVVTAKNASCPDGGTHCQQYCEPAPCNGSPLTAVTTKTATPDPYAAEVAQIFQTPPPLGVQSATRVAQGSGYTNGTRTFTVTGGTGTKAKILATVSGGKVTAILGVFDPGAYTVMPTGTVSATPDTGGGSGATFTLNEGCYTWPGTAVGGVAWTPIPGRKYCSIFATGQQHINFPTGTYWIAGGDSNCVGYCMSGNNVTMTSDVAGVTFLLTNGEGTGTFGTTSYAYTSIKSGTVSLCAPGTNCGKTCVPGGSCLLFVQNPAATVSTAPKTPANTDNIFNGNGTNTLSGLIYLPRQTFDNSGTSSIGGCFGVIAKYVMISGTPTFSDGCLPGNGIGGGTTTVSTFSNPRLYQ